MEKDSGTTIQGPALGRGNATSPYTVKDTDKVAEFIGAGDVTCTTSAGNTVTTVLVGSRYAIASNVSIITFGGVFNVS